MSESQKGVAAPASFCRRADAVARGAIRSAALGAIATVAFALSAPPIIGPVADASAALGATDLGRGAVGLAFLLALQSLLVAVLAALAFLAVEISPLVGAGSGLVAVLLPALVAAAVEGPIVFAPALLVVERLAGGCVAMAAGALGVVVGRALLRRLRT